MARHAPDPNETKEQRFKRVAQYRVNDILDRLRIIGNCSNRNVYGYTDEQVERIFSAIQRELDRVRAQFSVHKGTPEVKL